MKDTVLFDLGGTLVDYYTRAEFPALLGRCIAQVRDFLRRCRLLRLDPEALAEHVTAEDYEDPAGRVRPLEDRLVRIFEIDEAIHPPELVQEMCRRFLGPIFALAKVHDDAAPTLRGLRSEGYRTALVSNTPWGSPADLWREEVRRLGLEGLFDAEVFCRNAGWRKPAPEVFRFAMRVLEARPEQCLFVGDDPRWDLAGPRGVGMDAVLIDRAHRQPPAEDVIHGLKGIWTKLHPSRDAPAEE